MPMPLRSGVRRALVAGAAVVAAVASLVVTQRLGASGRGSSVQPVVDARAAQDGVVDLRLTPIADTTLDRLRPSVSMGAEPTLGLGRQMAPDDDTQAVLLRFALPELDRGSVVVSATLTLMRVGAVGAASVAAGLGSLSEPFDEQTATWSNRPDIAGNGGAVYIASALGERRFDVAWAVEEALAAQRHLGLQLEVSSGGCEAGRSRVFASRESPSGAPELRLVYVGPGTPHPFPSPTATDIPTETPTPTGTRPPTATATPTSNRPQPRPPVIFEPPAGAVVPPPEGVDALVVRWRQFAPTLCSYHLVLTGPSGPVFATDLPNTHATCLAVDTATAGMPSVLMDGTYEWQLSSVCPPFMTQDANSPPFEVRTLPSPAATASATAETTSTATATSNATVRPDASATAPASPTGRRATDTPVPTRTLAPPRTSIYLPQAVRGKG